MKTKQKEIRKSKLYKWVDNTIFNNGGLLCGLLIVGMFFGCIFWFPQVTDQLGYTDNKFDAHGINNWVWGIIIFIVWEIFYIWICKNDSYIKEANISLAKIMSFGLTYFSFTIIIPGSYFIWKAIKDIEWIYTLKVLGVFVLCVVGIIVCGWLFYRLNVWIFKLIRGNGR